MTEPINVPIPIDPVDLATLAYDYLEANIPGFDRSRGDAMCQLIDSAAQMLAIANEPASDVPLLILRYIGRWVDGLLPIDATFAQTTATVTALDDAGYTIDDGDRFEVLTSGDTSVVFAAVGSVTIPPGSTSTAAGEVVLVAETAGADGSGLPIDSTVRPVDAIAWIDTVTLTAITTGGIDAETDDEYLGRWITLRQLSNDTPILAVDAADLVRVLIPGIGRALGIDNYNPADSTYGNEKYVTVAVADPTGEPVATGIKVAADALLQSKRELNFVFVIVDPNYLTIGVSALYVAYPGFDLPTLDAAVEAALTSYLLPVNSGIPPGSDGTQWVPDTFLRYLEIAQVVNGVEGVNYITALSIGRVQNVTAVAASDILTAAAHGLVSTEPVVFTGLAGGAPLVSGTTYYARDITTNTYKVAATSGGTAINLSTDITAGTFVGYTGNDVALPQPAPLTRPGPISATGSFS